jgi:hypothetical protein
LLKASRIGHFQLHFSLQMRILIGAFEETARSVLLVVVVYLLHIPMGL